MQFFSSIVAWVLAVVLKELIFPLSLNLMTSKSWKTDLSFADKTFFFSKIDEYISLKNNCFSLTIFGTRWILTTKRWLILSSSRNSLNYQVKFSHAKIFFFFFFECYRLVRVLSLRSHIGYFRPFSIFLLLFGYVHFLFYI